MTGMREAVLVAILREVTVCAVGLNRELVSWKITYLTVSSNLSNLAYDYGSCHPCKQVETAG
jgi:hypothetical protein